MIALSMDPGIRGPGAALWVDKKLVLAAYVKNPLTSGSGPREAASAARAVRDWCGRSEVDLIIVEWPQIYQRAAGQTKGDPNALLSLAGIDSALAALFPEAEVQHYLPKAWKGDVQKPKHAGDMYPIERRVRERLRPEELAAIDWPTANQLTWDVTDAIGVGLHGLGRFAPHRVFARD